MQRLREFWNAFRNFAIVFSFIMNFTLIIILMFTMYLIFDIKKGIAEPLVDGLHSNFVGLDQAVIKTTVPVEDTIPVTFDLVVEDRTVVTLAQDAQIDNVPAVFEITGGGGTITGNVDIVLPRGTPLTIDLVLPVPVDQEIPIELPVEVEIALSDTELSVPFNNLRDLLNPYVRILDNLPNNWDEVPDYTLDALGGEINLMADTEDSLNPWDKAKEYGLEVPEDEDTTTTDTPVDSPAGQPDSPSADGPIPLPTATFTPFPSTTD